MSAIFSYEMWFFLAERIFNALLPVLLVLLLMAWKFRGSFVRSPALSLLVIFALLDFSIRIFMFFGGIPYQGRYFHILIIISCIFGAAGFLPLVHMVSGLGSRYKWLTYERALAGIVIIVLAVHVGKALSPPDRKLWLDELPPLISKNCPQGRIPVLVSEDDDPRIAYYAGAEKFRLFRPDAVNFFLGAAVTASTKDGERKAQGILSDGRRDAMVEFTGPAELVIEPLKPYVYSRGTIILAGEGLEDLQIALPENCRNETRTLRPEKNLDGTFSVSYLGFPAESFRIMAQVPEGRKWKLSEMSLVLDDKWDILRSGRENTTGYKFPATPARKIGEIGQSFKELGDDNVFLMVRTSDKDFRKIFDDAACKFPFRLIAEKKDSRKGFYTLYQAVPE